MNEIKIFKNPEFGKVRTVQVNDEVWLVGKDVATALGYSNSRKALTDHVDDEDKGVTKCDTLGGQQNLVVINESGLYSLVLSSKLPTAKKFKRWVTSEVLPSIRKHGAYMNDETLKRAILEPDFLIKLATELKEEKEQRKLLEEKIDSDKPKVIFADAVSASKSTILIGDLAKLIKQNGIDMGQKRLFEWLRENGYLIKRLGSDRNMPTQRSMELGLFEVKETAVTHSDGHTTVSKTPKVTGKGQEYFVNKFLTERSELT